MRLVALLFVAAACSKVENQPLIVPDAAREPTFEVAYLDQIDGKPATHVAIGGRMRVRLPEPATFMSVVGPFVVTTSDDQTLVVRSVGQGSGHVEIETATGYTRFAVTSASIEKVELGSAHSRAVVALLDAGGNRLVDSTLRLAGGGAPVSFVDAWDQIDVANLRIGAHAVFVQSDMLGATRVQFQKVAATRVAGTTP